MSRGRLLILFGSLVSLCAAVGLLLFGAAAIRVLDILTRRIGEPVNDLSGGLMAAAVSALLFGAGATAVYVGQLVVAKTEAASIAGRCLLVLSAAASVLGALAIAYGLGVARHGFLVIATSPTATKPSELQEAISHAVAPATFGFAVLLLAQVLLVAVGAIGFTRDSPRSGSLVAIRILGSAAAVFSLLFALLFAVNWLHGRSLETLVTVAVRAPSLSEIARHLSAILWNSQLAGVCLAVGGVCQGIVAFLLPGKSSELDADAGQMSR